MRPARAEFVVRPARADDARAMAEMFAAVAAEPGELWDTIVMGRLL